MKPFSTAIAIAFLATISTRCSIAQTAISPASQAASQSGTSTENLSGLVGKWYLAGEVSKACYISQAGDSYFAINESNIPFALNSCSNNSIIERSRETDARVSEAIGTPAANQTVTLTGKVLGNYILWSNNCWWSRMPLTETFTVDGSQGPWLYVKGGLNNNFQYGNSSQAAPVIINSKSGFNFKPGAVFIINYMSGSLALSQDGHYYAPNGDGYPGDPVNDGVGNSGKWFPSHFFDHADFPARLGALIGVFADDSGSIVGKPFLIGNFRSCPVPPGATQLQLGINNDLYGSNEGTFLVTVGQ
jgi:hypothetical protein